MESTGPSDDLLMLSQTGNILVYKMHSRIGRLLLHWIVGPPPLLPTIRGTSLPGNANLIQRLKQTFP